MSEHSIKIPKWVVDSGRPLLFTGSFAVLAILGSWYINAETSPRFEALEDDIAEAVAIHAAVDGEEFADIQEELDGLTDTDQILRDRVAAVSETANLATQEARDTRAQLSEATESAREQRLMMIQMMQEQGDAVKAQNAMILQLLDK